MSCILEMERSLTLELRKLPTLKIISGQPRDHTTRKKKKAYKPQLR